MSVPSVPTAIQVAQTLTALLGKNVKAKTQPSVGLQLKEWFVATYDASTTAIEALCLFDFPATASLGAALTLMHPKTAEEAIKTKKVPPELLENIREVANILANSYLEKRVRLKSFSEPAISSPADVSAFAASKVKELHLLVDVAGYPSGKVVFIASDVGATS